MSEEELIKDYENKLKRVFKNITVKVHTYEKEVTSKTGVQFAIHLGEEVNLFQSLDISYTNGEYFKVIIGDKVYFKSYIPIEKVKFKDMLKFIYESYWYDIFDKYINFAAMSRYLPIKEKGESNK